MGQLQLTWGQIGLALIPLILYLSGDLAIFALSETGANFHTLTLINTPVVSEISARNIWIAAIFVLIWVSLAVATIAIYDVTKVVTLSSLKRFALAFIGFGATLVTYNLLGGREFGVPKTHMYMGYTFFDLAAGRSSISDRYGIVLNIADVAAAVAATATVLGAVSCLAKPVDSSHDINDLVQRVTRQARRLANYLYMGAILLVAGIVFLAAWLRWPLWMISNPDEKEAYSQLALSVATYFGALYSLVLLGFYVPTAFFISRRTEKIANIYGKEASPPMNHAQLRAWKEENGLMLLQSAQLAKIGSIFAPLVAAPIGSLLVSLADK